MLSLCSLSLHSQICRAPPSIQTAHHGIATRSLLRLSGLSLDVIGPDSTGRRYTNILCLCAIDQAIIMGLGAVRDIYPIDSIWPVLEFRS